VVKKARSISLFEAYIQSPEYAEYFKKFVDDMGDIPPEFKKKISAI